MAYATVLAFLLVAVAFVLGSLLLGKLVRPRHLYEAKLETYECGERPVGQAWFNFNPRFYIIALVYVVFDVEIAFLYPIASVFKRWVTQGRGGVALLELGTFVMVLLVGLAYVWAKGDLDWVRGLKPAPTRARSPIPIPDERTPEEPVGVASGAGA